MMGRRLCVWVLLSCLLQIDFGLGARLTLEPVTFQPGVSPNVFLSCKPGYTSSTAAEIILLQIKRTINSETSVLATARPNADPTLDSAFNPKKFIVNGTVDMVNLDKSFLDLVINFPEEEDEGLYSCLVWFMSKHGTLLPASEEMYLQSRAHTEATLQKQLLDVQQKLNNVVTRVKTLENQVFKLELGHKNNSEQIYSLVDKANNKISFFATFVDKFNVHPNDVLIFDDVKLNDGFCYNSSTGTFLAPVTGLYVFNLFFEVEAPKAIKMQIKLEADNYVISRLFVYAIDDLRGSQASGSVVYRLAAGSQVKASVEYLSMEVKSQARLANGGLSVFSGFLL